MHHHNRNNVARHQTRHNANSLRRARLQQSSSGHGRVPAHSIRALIPPTLTDSRHLLFHDDIGSVRVRACRVVGAVQLVLLVVTELAGARVPVGEGVLVCALVHQLSSHVLLLPVAERVLAQAVPHLAPRAGGRVGVLDRVALVVITLLRSLSARFHFSFQVVHDELVEVDRICVAKSPAAETLGAVGELEGTEEEKEEGQHVYFLEWGKD